MPTIAIIDQDADSRLLARAVLGSEYHVTEFDSAERAALYLADMRPDLILLDVALPGLDGLYVLEWLRSAPLLRQIPVIAFTAFAQRGRELHFKRAGFDACVSKPLADETDLLNPVRRLLARESAWVPRTDMLSATA